MNPFQRILVPVDGSETSKKALEATIQLARAMDGQIRVMHAIDEAMATVKAAGVACDSLLVDELGPRLGESVAQAARDWKADLIVVGTHGRRGFNRLVLGSGAEQIIRLAPAPVMVIRPADAT